MRRRDGERGTVEVEEGEYGCDGTWGEGTKMDSCMEDDGRKVSKVCFFFFKQKTGYEI